MDFGFGISDFVYLPLIAQISRIKGDKTCPDGFSCEPMQWIYSAFCGFKTCQVSMGEESQWHAGRGGTTWRNVIGENLAGLT